MKFPIFKNKSELENSKWSNYFIHIYGKIPDTGYPIDLNTFWILYTNILKKYDIKLTDQCIEDSNCFTICPNNNGGLFSNMSYIDDMDNTMWIYHKPPYNALPNNSVVEVIHTSGGYPMQRSIESVGSWMYYAKGSGIYFDTGNTISFKDHSESVKHFLDIDISCPLREECAYYFKDLFTKAKNEGYDSIQYLEHYDMRCGNTAIEIVDLHGVGAYPCGNKTDLNIKSGWNGKDECICDNHKQSINCKVKDNIIGGYDVTKPDYFRFQFMKHHTNTYKAFFILIVLIIISFILIVYYINKYYIKKIKNTNRRIHSFIYFIIILLIVYAYILYLVLYRFQ